MNQSSSNPQTKSTASGFLLLCLVLSFIFIVVVLMPLEPSDYWTYLRIGDEIHQTRAIPATEFMTYTSGGQPATYTYWLASLIFLALANTGGLWLTVLVMGLCVCGFYAFVWLCLRRLNVGSVSASLLLLITSLIGSNNWSTRPQIFALPLFGFTLYILVRWLQKDDRLLWYLPILSVLWVNLHGSFILLFVLLFSALIFGSGNRNKLLVVTIISLVLTLVNPYGWGIWTHTAGMIGNETINSFSAEWQPPINQGWQMNLFFGSLLVVAIITAFTSARVKLIWWVWFLGFGWMAVSSLRYVLWFSVIEVLLLAQLASPCLERFLERKTIFPSKRVNLILGIAVLVLSLAFLPGVRQRWWKDAPANLTDTTPVQAVEWLKENPDLQGEMWANWVANIYMSYMLPERKVWITNRIEDFNEQLFLDNERLMRAAYDWQSILDDYGVNLLLLDQAREIPLITAIKDSTEWQEIYRDDRSLIFSRN